MDFSQLFPPGLPPIQYFITEDGCIVGQMQNLPLIYLTNLEFASSEVYFSSSDSRLFKLRCGLNKKDQLEWDLTDQNNEHYFFPIEQMKNFELVVGANFPITSIDKAVTNHVDIKEIAWVSFPDDPYPAWENLGLQNSELIKNFDEIFF